jgi:hypothetical protein
MTTQINQTREEHLKIIEKNNNVKGVGVLLFDNSFTIDDKYLHKQIEGQSFTKYIIPDINYQDIIDMGEKSICFKFIPYNVTIKIGGVEYEFNSYNDIPKDQWFCR